MNISKQVFEAHGETHRSHHIGWLRAAVLGANDGVISTSSLIVGVSAAHATHESIMISAVAGLVAGAMSMAAGEYVSVSSQSDIEKADLETERNAIENNLSFEREELAHIYVERGLDPLLAKQVAFQLMEHDALGAHARDELGISLTAIARPVQAALTSAVTFSVGAAVPLLIAIVTPEAHIIPIEVGASLLFLAVLGASAAKIGGASIFRGATRVSFWGALAMLLTMGIGVLFGTIV